MSKKTFTQGEISKLSNNFYVKSVSSKGITYRDEFKRYFIAEYENGKLPKQIFEECGFDIEIIGERRVRSSTSRWCAAYRKNGITGLTDTRKENTGRPSERELKLEERYARLEAQNNLLKAENELLKKIEFSRKEAKGEEIKLSAEQRYLLIHSIIEKYKLKNKLRYLCDISGVSRSGYYNYFTVSSHKNREEREKKDEKLRDVIIKAYKFKNRKKGARQIKMTLADQFKVVFNLKRIRRIMKKYGIVCPIRKSNPYRKMMKATQEHRVLPNLLQRQFKQGTPGKVLLTDITYLLYGQGKKAYLSTIKDGSTNEILAYNVSDRITLDIAMDTLCKLKQNRKVKLAPDAFIHSDQGVHYTSPLYQKRVRKYKLGQSMSRRGNCWDNAPQESFFGHFKDEAFIKPCNTLEELKKEINSYMIYYNNFRYQWNLKKMTPVQYRNHLLKIA
ncbi:IS3 family transposase [Bacillus sp. FJAT-49736]|uniref:IS3 family transposase n=1 Tax=Bacillus sp. FJAT-49736 TaxID=2833582 RepID=UPI001BC9F77D|nr:IS3 family transposase [Bacillus sp. FJAT-49736]MBS4172708.1 IS3 family transposase [Bacillus sp. FJAT-49736]MBS4173123.1 IS3 family transposase [Bacillus sp. FJAT-49736]MBS4175787.1 IS3 family transposase [Bacillus sp. FJAT-49736]